MLDRTLKHGLDYNMCMIVHRVFHDGLPGLLLGALVVVGCSGPSLDMRASCGAAVVEHDVRQGSFSVLSPLAVDPRLRGVRRQSVSLHQAP